MGGLTFYPKNVVSLLQEIIKIGFDWSGARLYATASLDENAKVDAMLQEVFGMVEKRGRSTDGNDKNGDGKWNWR